MNEDAYTNHVIRSSSLDHLHRSTGPVGHVIVCVSRLYCVMLGLRFMHRLLTKYHGSFQLSPTIHFSLSPLVHHNIVCKILQEKKILRCQHVNLQEGLVWLPLLCSSGVKTHMSSFGHAAMLCRFVLYKLAGWVWWSHYVWERAKKIHHKNSHLLSFLRWFKRLMHVCLCFSTWLICTQKIVSAKDCEVLWLDVS